jgi:hypothetical protein
MLRKTLGRLVKYGRLTVIRPDGTELQFGGCKPQSLGRLRPYVSRAR